MSTFYAEYPVRDATGGTVTSVATGTGLTGGPITSTGTISLANTAVTPGSYTLTNLTVDQQGRITAASNGTVPIETPQTTVATGNTVYLLTAASHTVQQFTGTPSAPIVQLPDATTLQNGQRFYITNRTNVSLEVDYNDTNPTGINLAPDEEVLFILMNNATTNGVWDISVIQLGANTTLSNLASPTSINQDLIPASSQNLGTAGNAWSDLFVNQIDIGGAGLTAASTSPVNIATRGVDGGDSGAVTIATGLTTTSGASGALTLITGDAAASSGAIAIFTGSSSLDDATGGIAIGTGETVTATSGSVTLKSGGADSGTTGNVLIQTGATSGTRGKIKLDDGSAVVGYIWTATNTDGSGHYAVPSATGLSGIVPIANGGTALSTTPTNGQILVGNGTNYTLATLTAGTGVSISNGAGTITITNTESSAFTTKTANYTITSTDGVIYADTSGGSFTLTLPDPATVGGHIYRIKDSTGSFNTNNLTIARFGSEKIEGLASSLLASAAWGAYTLASNGTDWFKL